MPINRTKLFTKTLIAFIDLTNPVLNNFVKLDVYTNKGIKSFLF